MKAKIKPCPCGIGPASHAHNQPAKATPGPWVAHQFTGELLGGGGRRGGWTVGKPGHGYHALMTAGDRNAANARLIASAPTLLAAAKYCLRSLESINGMTSREQSMARVLFAAIQKSEGI